jgi:hypothetical protein
MSEVNKTTEKTTNYYMQSYLKIIEILKHNHIQVLYGDTDSIIIESDLTDTCRTELTAAGFDPEIWGIMTVFNP